MFQLTKEEFEIWKSQVLTSNSDNSIMTLSKYAHYIKRADKTRASFLENVV